MAPQKKSPSLRPAEALTGPRPGLSLALPAAASTGLLGPLGAIWPRAGGPSHMRPAGVRAGRGF